LNVKKYMFWCLSIIEGCKNPWLFCYATGGPGPKIWETLIYKTESTQFISPRSPTPRFCLYYWDDLWSPMQPINQQVPEVRHLTVKRPSLGIHGAVPLLRHTDSWRVIYLSIRPTLHYSWLPIFLVPWDGLLLTAAPNTEWRKEEIKQFCWEGKFRFNSSFPGLPVLLDEPFPKQTRFLL